MKRTPVILVALVGSAIQAFTHATPAVPQQPLATKLMASSGLKVVSKSAWAPAGTQQLVVHSESVGRDFTVVIAQPPGDFALEGRRLSVVYALDGGHDIAGPISQFMGGAGTISLAYVVSVGSLTSPDRATDFLDKPITRDGLVIGGGGAKFRAFLLEELRPYLEAHYAMDSTKSFLMGHSLGGTFVARLLSEAPEAFSAYIIASPAVASDPALPEALAKVAAKGQGRRVYVTVGEREPLSMQQGADQIVSALSGSGSTFKVDKRVFAGESHVSYIPQLLPAALAWMLPPPPPAIMRTAMALAPEALERLVGVYAVADGRTITITRNGGQLFSELSTSGRKAPLWAETPQTFFVQGFDYIVTFEGAANGPPTGLQLRLNGAEVKATRREQ